MPPKDTKKLISFSSPSAKNLLESVVKDHCEISRSSQSLFIERTLSKEVLPSDWSALSIVEKLYTGTSLAEAYVLALKAVCAMPAAKSEPLVREFYHNISLLQPRFTSDSPAFQQVLIYADGIMEYLKATAEQPHLVMDLKTDLEKWPHLTPIMFCVAPILSHWDFFHRSSPALSMLVACAEIAAPKIVDTPRERISFIDALKHW